MSLTPNYGMNIPASTDTVNLLTQNYPNFNIIDTALKSVSDSAITVAVETKVGTVHNLVRSDSDRAVIRFTATSDYIAGDTFTVDGNAVTVVTPGGASIPDRGFVINSNVLGILVGAVLTLLVGGGLTSVDAIDVDYDNTGSGLTATDVQNAIDEVEDNIENVASSIPTYSDFANTLFTMTETALTIVPETGISLKTVRKNFVNAKTNANKEIFSLSGYISFGTVNLTSGTPSKLATLTGLNLGARATANRFTIGGLHSYDAGGNGLRDDVVAYIEIDTSGNICLYLEFMAVTPGQNVTSAETDIVFDSGVMLN